MDFLSIILSAIGWGKDRANKASDRKIEAYRLNAEVAAECMRTVNLIATSRPGLLRRANASFGDYPEVIKTYSDALDKLEADTGKCLSMAEGYKPIIEKGSAWANWDNILMQFHQWRATAANIYPYTEDVLKKLEDAVRQGEELVANRPQPVAKPRDRGWDAPPL